MTTIGINSGDLGGKYNAQIHAAAAARAGSSNVRRSGALNCMANAAAVPRANGLAVCESGDRREQTRFAC
jgi:hypothetical protein